MKFRRFFQESQTRMGVDDVLNKRNEIFRYQIKPTGTAAAIVQRRPIQIVIRPTSIHVGIDHGQQLDETRCFVMVIVENSA